MIYGFESDVKIDDDILKAELGNNGEVQLKNIIRTIQKEQNAIIRNTKDRILVIQERLEAARHRWRCIGLPTFCIMTDRI